MGRQRRETTIVADEVTEVPSGFAALADEQENKAPMVVEEPPAEVKVSPRKKYDVLYRAGRKQLVCQGVDAVDESEAIQRGILQLGIPLVEVSKLKFEVMPSGNAA